VLGVRNQDPTVAVIDAYRELAKRHHPDRNPGDEAALKAYLAVQEAYERFKKERGL
jgi:DnaJ-class molecular chaperone